jgi:hypothetical protein
MHNHFDRGTEHGERGTHRRGVANVNDLVALVLKRLLQPCSGGRSGCFGAKESRPHVVVEADDVESLGVETLAGFRTNQAGRAGNKGNTHNGKGVVF